MRRRRRDVKLGTAYLLCFDPPYKHAAHYIGWTELELDDRLRKHLCGTGSNLVRVQVNAGGACELVKEWRQVTREFERSLKRQGGARRICPRCNPRPRIVAAAAKRDRARAEELGLVDRATLPCPF